MKWLCKDVSWVLCPHLLNRAAALSLTKTDLFILFHARSVYRYLAPWLLDNVDIIICDDPMLLQVLFYLFGTQTRETNIYKVCLYYYLVTMDQSKQSGKGKDAIQIKTNHSCVCFTILDSLGVTFSPY